MNELAAWVLAFAVASLFIVLSLITLVAHLIRGKPLGD